MIRLAAAADVHLGRDPAGSLRPHLQDIDRHADMLLIAGDLTTFGHPDEARVLAAELAACRCRRWRCWATTTTTREPRRSCGPSSRMPA